MCAAEGLIAHRVSGEGPPVLLLNGIAMTMAGWDPVAAGLKTDFSVIRCDFRGQLHSPGPVPEQVTDHARDVALLLAATTAGPVHVLGTSFGGLIGVLLAARYPDRVRSLTIIASADRFDEAMSAEVARWRAACRHALVSGNPEHILTVMEPVVYGPSFRATHASVLAARRVALKRVPQRWFTDLEQLMASTEGADLAGELNRVRCPATVVAAGADGLIPVRRVRALAEGMAAAQFRVWNGIGHAAVVEAPEMVVAACRETIARSAQQEDLAPDQQEDDAADNCHPTAETVPDPGPEPDTGK